MAYKQLVDEQRAFWLTSATKSLTFRIEALEKLYQCIQENTDDIVQALTNDFQKPPFETWMTEIATVLEEIKITMKNLRKWSKPQKVKTPAYLFRSSSKVYFEPYGCVLIITAWNYPFLLAISPLVGAIAAGNCCIVKPSELTPQTSKVIEKIILSTFDAKHCAAIQGGKDTTEALLEEKFDFIHYTGSEQTGKIIAMKAAGNLTPVVLEMGGKSPCIVDETSDIKSSARRIVWGKFINAGQTCIAPDYVYVHSTVKEQLTNEIIDQIQLMFYENYQNGNFCRIIHQKAFDRLKAYLKNTTVAYGGAADQDKLLIEPTVLHNVNWTHPIMQEEIFGPILPILEYQDINEVIDEIKKRSKPLALYIFSRDKKIQRRLLKEISFGGGCINTTVLHTANPHLPFGGVGNSGMGCYHGIWGFRTFSHAKGILAKAIHPDIPFLYPPYHNKTDLLKIYYR